MASSSTFSLGDIINVSLPENQDVKCFGTSLITGGTKACGKDLGKERKLAARRFLQHAITYEDLSGDLVKKEIQDLAQLLVRCDHKRECRVELQDKWLGLLEQHRTAQVAAQRTEQPLDPETTRSLPITPEDTETSAHAEPPIIEEPIPEGQIRYPTLPILDTEESTTEVLERLEVLAPTPLRRTLETLPPYHPTPFARRVPTIHEDFSISMSSNWILSCMIGFIMQIGQNVLAIMFMRFGRVSTEDQAGRITKPVTRLNFLLGVNFTIDGLNFAFYIYTLLFLALFRLAFSVLWPLSGYLAGGCIVLLAVSGLWNRRLAIEE